MTTYALFRETNDHEGESWNFWLERDGNEETLRRLGEMLDAAEEACPYDFPYVLDLDEALTDEQVDLLCEYAEEGYMHSHNKINGTLVVPDDLVPDDLYKGRIEDLFG